MHSGHADFDGAGQERWFGLRGSMSFCDLKFEAA
jgi:hypothetical protein